MPQPLRIVFSFLAQALLSVDCGPGYPRHPADTTVDPSESELRNSMFAQLGAFLQLASVTVKGGDAVDVLACPHIAASMLPLLTLGTTDMMGGIRSIIASSFPSPAIAATGSWLCLRLNSTLI